MALSFNSNLRCNPSYRGPIIIEDRNWVRILDCNGEVSREATLGSASGYPVRGYWENDYVVVEMSNGRRMKIDGCIGYL